jgi:hypothetical protein
MASYYQVLVTSAPRGNVRLTKAGRERLQLLQARFSS